MLIAVPTISAFLILLIVTLGVIRPPLVHRFAIWGVVEVARGMT
jgi:hypothetical protein